MIFGLQAIMEHPTGLTGTTLLFLLIVLSIALALAGRRLVRALAFITGGLAIGSIGVSLTAAYLPGTGNFGALLGGAVGVFVGGFIGLAMVYFGIGIGIGYLGYVIASSLVSNHTILLAVGIVLFVAGVFLASKILSVATSILGGILIYNVLSSLGAEFVLSSFLGAGIALFGIWVQMWSESRYSQRAPPIQAGNAT